MANIRDVARVAGVSVTTVSFVMNNSNPSISLATRERVLKAASDLSYRPNRIAKSLVSGRADQIAVVFGESVRGVVNNSWAGALLEGMLNSAEDLEIGLLIVPPGKQTERTAEYVSDGRVDGCIICTPEAPNNLLEMLHKFGFPVATIGPNERNRSVSGIIVDTENIRPVNEIVDYLVSHNHIRIGHIAGQQSQGHAKTRLDAYLAAMKRHRLEPFYIESELSSFEHFQLGIEQTIESFLKSANCTAVFAANDHLAHATYRVCRRNGWSIPRDLSVVGFDDAHIAIELVPKLTTVHQPIFEMGEMAFKLLVNFVSTGVRPPDLMLQTRMVVRDSVGKI